jgi:predicted solute-binding protein
MSARSAASLLGSAPCALIIGDEALRALARGFHVVVDVGALARDVLGIHPVYAATVVIEGRRCPSTLESPPWPRAERCDVEATARITGLPRSLAEKYHYTAIRLDYNPTALKRALQVLGEALKPSGTSGAELVSGERF